MTYTIYTVHIIYIFLITFAGCSMPHFISFTGSSSSLGTRTFEDSGGALRGTRGASARTGLGLRRHFPQRVMGMVVRKDKP